MRSNAVKDGWQRFLDRLRRLWGQRGDGGLSKPLVNAAVASFERGGAMAATSSCTSTMFS
ncbi:MAG: hypothetical protein ACHQDD_04210 [Steroidobacterales bacterium]